MLLRLALADSIAERVQKRIARRKELRLNEDEEEEMTRTKPFLT